ncbi:NAD-dependent epimerase/dehydratase family protein [Vibrio tubiashii]|jgi:nucleoside-diphosphate-sugar epimerase|uniref:O-antigen biosynthetic protein, WbjF n=1 Tax=Vibrio tubiashii ATCC 19109 TaxID=1051646 RepID=F9T0H6_9VIBR|nr:NAD-dependent epimerase/dehydratase family protein [Vibrio tubiashii]AIW12761.1 UDP-glucose 4-epimerase [Vibrio tubiashii ATCC 19109]EGU58736.1 O-antigen biosynthetic protein, WbjF [Vibrio tubiashii ATCC 19109]EIF02948.1 O-antigen biosynthetic protein WbjF [Vibrio tubiashii NCIMB 1337 = ATCC 19106]
MTCLFPERVLLTGANGFIGSCVNQYLDFKCAVAVRDPVKCRLNNRAFLLSELVNPQGDLSNFNGIDSIIHLAGLAHSKEFSAQEHNAVNTKLTLDLAKAAAKGGVKRFVFVSSITVNGVSSRKLPYTESSIAFPHTPHANSKYNAELGLKKLAKAIGLEVVIVRPTLVYGPNAPGNFGMLTKLVAKSPLLPFGMADNCRDFIAVQNLADLLITCAIHPDAAGQTFLASDGETVSIKEFTCAIADGLGKNVIQLPLPVSVMRFAGRLIGQSTMIEQLYGNLEVDSSNIKKVLGWTPPLTMKQAMASLTENRL